MDRDLQDSYQSIVDDGVSGQVANATTNAQASHCRFNETPTTQQQQSLSGVSLDEESINMLQQQPRLPGRAAMFISRTLNTMLTSLLAITTAVA